MECVKKSIENSVCFGIYGSGNQMLGFARIVTGKAIFSYLMDRFIFEKFQGKGLGTNSAKHKMNHLELQVGMWLLTTQSAHGLYKKFGFPRLELPEKWMLKEVKNAAEKLFQTSGYLKSQLMRNRNLQS